MESSDVGSPEAVDLDCPLSEKALPSAKLFRDTLSYIISSIKENVTRAAFLLMVPRIPKKLTFPCALSLPFLS